MKKRFLIIGLILLISFLLIKIYHFVLFSKVLNAVKNFKNNDNRYYYVETLIYNSTRCKEEIILNNKKIKYTKMKSNKYLYYEWIDLILNDKYKIDAQDKILYYNDKLIASESFLNNIPNIILKCMDSEKIDIKNLFEIYIVFPTKYDDKKCYKIITRNEKIIIDQDTYLPICSYKRVFNAEDNSKDEVEYIYEFRTNDITEEDMQLPDLTGYKIVE